MEKKGVFSITVTDMFLTAIIKLANENKFKRPENVAFDVIYN